MATPVNLPVGPLWFSGLLIPDRDPAISVLHHIAEHTGQLRSRNADHRSLLSKIARTSPWAQVLELAVAPFGAAAAFGLILRRRRRCAVQP
jgi:hypothetical protein